MKTTGQALVLGGGGVAGVAWMTGLLVGLAEAGQDVTGADLVIGTSAGATVAAQVGSGLGLDELFARQTDPALQAAEIMVDIDLAKYAEQFGAYLAGATSPEETLRRVGAFALAAQTVPPAERLAVIASRLPSRDWPARPTRLAAVDCESGRLRVFDAQSGVSLIDAVAASCAVPGIWPPVTIDGRRYMDGGVRSSDNADLARRRADRRGLAVRPELAAPVAAAAARGRRPPHRGRSRGHGDRPGRRIGGRDGRQPARPRDQAARRPSRPRPGPRRPWPCSLIRLA